MGDFRVTAAGDLPISQKERRLKRFRLLTRISAGFFAALLIGFVIPVKQHIIASGYVTSDQYAEVRPPQPGKVAKIHAQTGARVKPGDLLVALDSSDEQAVLDEAKSRAEKAEAELTRREAEIVEEKRRLAEDIAVAHLKLTNVVSRLQRSRELYVKKFISEAALEDDLFKEQLAKAELAALTNRDLTLYDKQLYVLRGELEARQDAVERAYIGVCGKEIKAPIAGQVLRYEFVIGEMVRPEAVLYEIFGGDKFILKLRVPEQHATRVAVGNPYSARLSSYRGLKGVNFEGKVENLRNVIQSEGQQTYRVAFCSFDPQKYNVPPGTTAEARIYYGKTCLWFYLLGVH
jgi:HlyD family secretion protein